jgi:hypothetical protein
MSIQSNFPNLKPSLLLDFANTKQLDNRVTFTRSTPAVFYDGKTTAMAEQNLILQSQTFDNSPWSGTQLTVTGNVTTAPDGTNTADSIVPNTVSTANHQFAQNVNLIANKTFTLSIYVKAFGYTKFAFREAAITGAYATFNLASSGSVIATASIAEVTILGATITSVGNGWFRVTISLVSTSSALSMGFFALNDTYTSGDPYAAGFATGDGTSGVYIWGCQLEQRSTATAYTVTTTQPITNYIPVLLSAGGNQPRFDCNPTTGESLGLLIEEQRTNVVLFSQAFGSWSAGSATVQSDYVIAPDGTQTGDWIIGSTSGERVTQDVVFSGTTCTFSVYVKGTNWNFTGCSLLIRNSTTSTNIASTNFSGTTFTAGGGGGTSVSVGNGWYRLSQSVSSGITAGNTLTFYIYTDSVGGGNTNNTIFAWGAQVEAGTFATSYIATTSASATRTQDVANMTGVNLTSWLNNAQGTLYVNASRFGTNLYPRFVGFYSQNLESYSMGIGQWNASSITAYGVNNTVQFDLPIFPSGLTWGSEIKAALGYEFNNIGFTANNQTVATDTNATIPDITFFGIGGGINPALNGWIKKIAYYPIRVTNTQLQALTS